MRTRLLLTFLAAALVAGCGKDAPLAPTAPTEPSPSPSATPTPAPTIVRLSIAAYNDGGDLLDAWPRQARVTIEATPVCAASARVAALSATAGSAAARGAKLQNICKPPSYVDWRFTGAGCEPLGDAHGASVRVTCTLAGFVNVVAIARARQDGPEDGRGDAQFRVLP